MYKRRGPSWYAPFMLESIAQAGPQGALALVIGLVVALVVHEYAHARVAYALGDSTAAENGRMTVNPLAHIDLVGTILIPGILLLVGGFLFGWAKPVPVDARNFRVPRRDALLTALAGPAANILTAALFGFVAQILPHGTQLPGLAALIVLMNLTIAFFNILPVPPLDGASILSYLLAQRPHVMVFFERQGFTLLIGLLLLDSVAGGRILGTLIGLPVSFLSHLFLGRLTLL